MKTAIALILLIGIESKSPGQLFTEQDLKEADRYDLSNNIYGVYPVDDSIETIWFKRIDSLKQKITKLGQYGKDLQGLVEGTNGIYRFSDEDISRRSYDYFLPEGDCSFDFRVDTTNFTFSANETIMSNGHGVVGAYFHFQKTASGYELIGKYQLFGYTMTPRGFPYVITKKKLEILYRVLSDHLESSILSYEKTVTLDKK